MTTPVLSPSRLLGGGHRIVAIAASAGSLPALDKVLRRLPTAFPAPVLVVLHTSPHETNALEHVLARRCRLPIKAAEEGDALHAGQAYVVLAHRHLHIDADGTLSFADASRSSALHWPADSLLDSVAGLFGPEAVAVVLSGMGHNGAHSVKRLHDVGGFVIAQDEATSEHFSMPRSAIELGAVDRVLPIERVATALLLLTRSPRIANHSR